MKKNLVIASIAMSFILTVSLASHSLSQMALAQDLSTLKDEATKFLAGKDNGQRANNDSTSTTNTNNSTSSGSSLTEKATGALGGLLN
jgi:hypothetical protein